MKDIFKITTKIGDEEIELFFDDKNRAERFINAITEIMNEKGRKEVVFVPEIVPLIDSDKDILDTFHQVQAMN